MNHREKFAAAVIPPQQPTAEQWQAVHEALMPTYGSAVLDCDGYSLSLNKLQQGESGLAIYPYVNGSFKGKWILEDCEERRRFLRPVSHARYSAKDKKLYQKLDRYLGKKVDPKKYDVKITYYYWAWPSFASLKRHLIKNNNVIRLVAINGKPVKADALEALAA